MKIKGENSKKILEKTIATFVTCIMVFHLFPAIVFGIQSETNDERPFPERDMPEFATE